MLESIYGGYLNTVVVEKGFRKLQDISREQKNNRSARVHRWFELNSSNLLKEMGRQEVKGYMGELPTDLPRHIPQEIFSAMAMEPSIDDDDLLEIKENKKSGVSYPSPSAQSLQVQLGAWRVLVAAWQDDLWSKLADVYLSLLCIEDHIVFYVPTAVYFVVLKSCQSGMLVWPMEKFQDGHLSLFRPLRRKGSAAEWRHVFVLQQWQSIACKVISPAVFACIYSARGNASIGVYLMQLGKPRPLEVGAAESGFKHCNANHIDKLVRLFDLGDLLKGPDKLKGILPKVEALCKKLLPDITNEQLA
jgi:hypothetical protein